MKHGHVNVIIQSQCMEEETAVVLENLLNSDHVQPRPVQVLYYKKIYLSLYFFDVYIENITWLRGNM